MCSYLHLTIKITRIHVKSLKISNNTLSDKKTIYFTNQQGASIAPNGIAFAKNNGNNAVVYLKKGRGLFQCEIPYDVKNGKKIKCNFVFTLEPYAGKQKKAYAQGIAYHNNQIYEFNQYNGSNDDTNTKPGNTYIDTYNLSNGILIDRKIFQYAKYGYEQLEVQGMGWIGNNCYIDSISQRKVNGKITATSNVTLLRI